MSRRSCVVHERSSSRAGMSQGCSTVDEVDRCTAPPDAAGTRQRHQSQPPGGEDVPRWITLGPDDDDELLNLEVEHHQTNDVYGQPESSTNGPPVRIQSSTSTTDLLNINMGNEVNFYTFPTVQASSGNEHLKDRMRARLRFFFMNPVEKWQAKGRFPYKLLVQIFKVFLVTLQLCLFASYRYAHVNYVWDNKITFSHLFVKDWDPAREVSNYPPSMGPLAVYKREDFYEYLDYAVNGYINISDVSLSPFSYASADGSILPPVLCIKYYNKVQIFAFNESYIIDSKLKSRCLNLSPLNGSLPFSSKKFFKQNHFKMPFTSLLEADLRFTIKTVSLHDVASSKTPDCYRFDVQLLFDNSDYDGQMLVSLDADAKQLFCKGDTEYIDDTKYQSAVTSSVNILVILNCIISLLLCCRAIYRAQQLKWETVQFFKLNFNKSLSVNDRLEFLNMWYVMMIVDDILIVVGSAVKEKIERRLSMGDSWNMCSVLLGVGNLLVWFGVLRYLGFFKTYNVLILTLKRSIPNVARFLLCGILIYLGFVFCGWLILSPYHIKFRTLASTSECLFSLTNGDDMFATFAGLAAKSSLLWWFTRIYLYSFISLFIYVVLSLFIALIMDAYETIKQYYVDGFPTSTLHEFIAEFPIPANSGYFRSNRRSTFRFLMDKIKFTLCPKKQIVADHEEVEPLVA